MHDDPKNLCQSKDVYAHFTAYHILCSNFDHLHKTFTDTREQWKWRAGWSLLFSSVCKPSAGKTRDTSQLLSYYTYIPCIIAAGQ